jgi:YD repeat-containing protein
VLSRRDLAKLNGAAFSMDYGYEDDDDLSTLAHSGPAPVTYTLGRNPVGQITSLAVTDGAFLSRPPTNATDAYAANRLNQISTLNAAAFAYDANGNLTSDGALTFEYDEENRLRAASGTGMTATYEYDPLGRRRAKIVNGVVTKFASDAQEEVEERDGANAVTRRYAYGSGVDDRVAMFDASCAGGGRCFYLREGLDDHARRAGRTSRDDAPLWTLRRTRRLDTPGLGIWESLPVRRAKTRSGDGTLPSKGKVLLCAGRAVPAIRPDRPTG